MHKKLWTREEKAKIVKAYKDGKSIKEITKEFSIHSSTFYHWLEQFGEKTHINRPRKKQIIPAVCAISEDDKITELRAKHSMIETDLKYQIESLKRTITGLKITIKLLLADI